MATLVLRWASIMVLARMLLPEDFGLVGMVTALTVVAERFKDFGLDTATILSEKINHEETSALFWINSAVGGAIALLLIALAPALAWFYGDQRVYAITVALAPVFVFSGLTIQHQALLKRKMRFQDLAWLRVVSMTAGVVLAVWLGWRGFGYWALVWKELLTGGVAAVGTWLVCRWIPTVPSTWHGLGRSLRVGRDVTGFNLVYFLARSSDQVLIGRFWGAVANGFYRQANQLLLLPINLLHYPLDSVAVPALSSLRSDRSEYARYYSTFVSSLALLSMPLIAFLWAYADDIVLLALGKQWDGSAVIFRTLAPAAFIIPVWSTAGTVMITIGRTRDYFFWGAAHSIVLVLGFGVGVFWGPEGVASSYVITTYAGLVPSLIFAFRNSPVDTRLFWRSIVWPMAASLVAGFVVFGTSRALPLSGLVSRLAVGGLLTVLVYIGVLVLTPGGRKTLEKALALLRTIRTRNTDQSPVESNGLSMASHQIGAEDAKKQSCSSGGR